MFTDVEGSTRLVQRLGAEFRGVLEEHHRILREAIRGAGGIDLRTEGDAFFAVFESPSAAVAACVEAQRALASHRWPEGTDVRVRMGLHSGEGLLGGDDYLGIDVHRAARIAATGHGGQIVVSAATAALAEKALPEGVRLRDLGTHRLKDLPDAERLWQVDVPGLGGDFPPLRSLEVRVALPAYATSFVGRHEDVSRLRELLESCRLVTLTGPGGTGKTRLATEVARRVAERYANGVFFVDLSVITEPALVSNQIAAALGVEVPSGEPAVRAVVDAVGSRPTLLVLDNFEQVVSAAGDVSTLLAEAPGASLLVTSREALGIHGEQLFPLSPLGLGADPDEGPRGEAVELFVDRARAIDPSLELDAETLAAVETICARLDGMPLAIELAAGRVRALPVQDILARLDRRLPLLTGGPRDVPARQRTLRGAIEWSHDLLEEPERILFRRLSVFAGGWTLDAAEAVVDPQDELGDTLDLLASLVQKSLVRPNARGRRGRFGMYETIREFAQERLEESAEREALRERHARWVVELAEDARPHLIASDRYRWYELLAAEHDNLRAALDWSVERDRADVGLRIGYAVWRYWQARRGIAEGRTRVGAILALPSAREPNEVRARGLSALGGLAYWQADYPAMNDAYEEAVEIARALGDPKLLADALADYVFVFEAAGDHVRSRETSAEARALYAELGDQRGLAYLFLDDVFHAAYEKDLAAAGRSADEAVPRLREAGDALMLSEGLRMQALAAIERGDVDVARERLTEVLGLDVGASDGTSLAITLQFCAILASREGPRELAGLLLGGSRAVQSAFEVAIPEWIAELVVGDPVGEARESLGDEAVDEAIREGERLTVDAAIRLARGVLEGEPAS